jgi:Flp pilus assembly protein TadB
MDNEPDVRDGARQPSGGGRGFKQPWLVASIVLLASAGALLYFARPDAAFVAAVLGVSAWFYQVRANLKRRHDLVKLSGRNWVPRGDIEEADEDEEDEADTR